MTYRSGFIELAPLAEASYVLFDDAVIGNSTQLRLQLTLDKYEGRYSAAQAANFVSHWQVADHQPNTTSGFSATLFRRIDDDPVNGLQAGDLVLAMRGTETGSHQSCHDR